MNSSIKIKVAELISFLLIFLFAYTGLSKLMTVMQFERTLRQSPLLSDVASVVARLIPLTELAIVVLLLIPRFKKLGTWCSLVLLSLFTIYIAYMIAFTPHLPCSCGGILKQLSWHHHLVFNVCLIALSAVSIRLTATTKMIDSIMSV